MPADGSSRREGFKAFVRWPPTRNNARFFEHSRSMKHVAPYRFEAVSIEGFVQQLAAYIANGYWFYVSGRVPESKDAHAIDRKLLGRYGVAISKWARSRRKRWGGANVQYLRHGRAFVLLATKGEHSFFDCEPFKDFRRDPFRFHGYSIGCGRGVDGRFHASVRIHVEEYLKLKSHFVGLAVHRSAENLAAELHALPFAPFARVRRQYLCVLRAVNRLRRTAGFDAVPLSALRLRRRIVRPFGATTTSRDSEINQRE